MLGGRLIALDIQGFGNGQGSLGIASVEVAIDMNQFGFDGMPLGNYCAYCLIIG